MGLSERALVSTQVSRELGTTHTENCFTGFESFCLYSALAFIVALTKVLVKVTMSKQQATCVEEPMIKLLGKESPGVANTNRKTRSW